MREKEDGKKELSVRRKKMEWMSHLQFRFKYWIIDLLIEWFPHMENICRTNM